MEEGDNGVTVEARGVEEEYRLACEAGVVPLPVGSSGGMAKVLWRHFKDFERYQTLFTTEELKGCYEALGRENPCLTPSEVTECLGKIVAGLEANAFKPFQAETA
jgi:hypothetical protein